MAIKIIFVFHGPESGMSLVPGEAHLFLEPILGFGTCFWLRLKIWPRSWHFFGFFGFFMGLCPFWRFFLNFVFFEKYYITSCMVEHLFGDAILLVTKVHNCGLSLYEETFASLFRLILRKSSLIKIVHSFSWKVIYHLTFLSV